jgi:hypothetical protein
MTCGGVVGYDERVACYRLYAANCVELAQGADDRERRVFLLRMAQAWFRLAEQMEHPEAASALGEAPPRTAG